MANKISEETRQLMIELHGMGFGVWQISDITKRAVGTVAHTVKHLPRHPHKCGETHHNSKMTEAGVRMIRAHPELSTRELGRRLGVSHGAVGGVRQGKTWRHVK